MVCREWHSLTDVATGASSSLNLSNVLLSICDASYDLQQTSASCHCLEAADCDYDGCTW